MKIKIQKLPNGTIQGELHPGGKEKPKTIQLSPENVDSVISMLTLAKTAKVIAFELDLPDVKI